MPPRLGAYIRQQRLAAGLTQQEAADLSGMSVAALRDLEQGRIATPRSATLRRLAEGLGLSAVDAEMLMRYGLPGRLPAESLWLEILGPMALRIHGEPVAVAPARHWLLLAALALTPNTPVSEERLIEMIWGSHPPSNAGGLLRGDASRLRRRIRDVNVADQTPELAVTSGSYQLTVAENQLDLLLFRRLAGEAQAARNGGDPHLACRLFSDALGLWRGDPLAGLVSLRSDPAVLGLGWEWQARVVEYAETAIQFGRHGEVLSLLRRLVERHPLHEAAGAQLLRALTAAGDATTAMAVFDQLCSRLAEDFGTDPGPELRKAYQAARERQRPGIPRSAVMVRRQLPADLAEFTGRDAELTWLRARLAAPPALTAAPAVSIVGTGGVGKTRLAVRLVHQLLAAGEPTELQLHVELGEAEPLTALSSILGLLGVAGGDVPPDLAGRAAVYRDRLADRRALVLLDDATSEEQVEALLPADPANLTVVTSRRALALDGVPMLALGGLPPVDAERLLARIAGTEQVASDPPATRRLVAQCGHLPLAIALAGRRLRARPALGPAALADRVARAADPLRELAAGTDLLHATLDRSYQALPAPERRLFRLLGVSAGTELTPDAAARLAGVPVHRVRLLLDRLADFSLLTAASGDRYRLPPLLAAYVRQLTDEAPQWSHRGRMVGKLDQTGTTGSGDQPATTGRQPFGAHTAEQRPLLPVARHQDAG